MEVEGEEEGQVEEEEGGGKRRGRGGRGLYKRGRKRFLEAGGLIHQS